MIYMTKASRTPPHPGARGRRGSEMKGTIIVKVIVSIISIIMIIVIVTNNNNDNNHFSERPRSSSGRPRRGLPSAGRGAV